MKIALITALFGDLDTLKEIPIQSIPIDKFCFTNNHIIENTYDWKIIYPDYPRHDLCNRMKAKYFRMLSHKVEELQSYTIIIWIDASLQVISNEFINFMIKDIREKDIFFFKHHSRSCIYHEAEFSKTSKKYNLEPIDNQIQKYKSDSYPQNNGLMETGCFIRIINPETNKIMEDWWHENIKYSYQDQISLPYILWKNKFIAGQINRNIHDNEYFFKINRVLEKELL